MAAGKRSILYTSFWHRGQVDVRLLTPNPVSGFGGGFTPRDSNTEGMRAFFPRPRQFDNAGQHYSEVTTVANDTASILVVYGHTHRVKLLFLPGMPTRDQYVYDLFVDTNRARTRRVIEAVEPIDVKLNHINRILPIIRHGLETKGRKRP